MNSLPTRDNPAWEPLLADPGTHSVDAVPVNRRAIKHIFTQVQAFHGVFFFFFQRVGVFCYRCGPAPVLGSLSEGLGVDLVKHH